MDTLERAAREALNHAVQDFETYTKAGFDPVWSATKAIYDHRLFRFIWKEFDLVKSFHETTKTKELPAGTKVFFI